MSKRIEQDGKYFRVRRGVLVEIPQEWVGRVTTPQTINKRDSKLTNKLARATKWRRNKLGSSGSRYIDYIDTKVDQQFLT